MIIDDAHVLMLLALADDELVIGHRHSHWTGFAPHLEEDLAFSSIAQDEIGHAVVWYGLASERTGKDPDQLGLGRPAGEYRHAVVCERPNGDWGYTVARQLLYDLAEDIRLDALSRSAWREAAAATGALRREERYHLLHARAWLARLAEGPLQARERLVAGLREALPQAIGLFETLPGEQELLADGTLPVAHAEQASHWIDAVEAELAPFGLQGLVDRSLTPPARAGRHGLHSEEFIALCEEMTMLYRSEPGARW
ncbi:MAG: phenylacetate-CoA oxygenase subunit PaaC [Nitriliruptorales bacterium]|nr:phenylacetate-CoA oxygenase subunit PaaC [Nitriliruptorales bacterium]